MKEYKLDFYNKTCLKSYNLDESLRYQLGILDTLDAFTRKHSENVAAITCKLCENLKLNVDFIVYCTTCAFIHDIGKLYIPSKILQKQGPLTDEEYQIMKTHTTIGYKTCMEDSKLKPFSAGPKYHHEAIDGSGYPEGLKDEDIPLVGKIIRVADEFDAIVSKRQYKSHIGISDTLKILIDETKPNPTSCKISPIIVKALKRVVVSDIEIELSGLMDYLKYVKKEINRLKQFDSYYNKMLKIKKDENRQLYLEGIKQILQQGETIDNYKIVTQDYINNYNQKEINVKKLFDEIKIIKKLKV